MRENGEERKGSSIIILSCPFSIKSELASLGLLPASSLAFACFPLFPNFALLKFPTIRKLIWSVPLQLFISNYQASPTVGSSYPNLQESLLILQVCPWEFHCPSADPTVRFDQFIIGPLSFHGMAGLPSGWSAFPHPL
jgi:hypothetical protein